jgi:hypothetical protein
VDGIQGDPIHRIGDPVGGDLIQHGDDLVEDRRGVDGVLRGELVVQELLDVAKQVASDGLVGGPDAHGAAQQDEIPQTARLRRELLTKLGLARERLLEGEADDERVDHAHYREEGADAFAEVLGSGRAEPALKGVRQIRVDDEHRAAGGGWDREEHPWPRPNHAVQRLLGGREELHLSSAP